MDMFPMYYLFGVISLSIGLAINLDLYLRHTRSLKRRTSNLDVWESALHRREEDLEERGYDLREWESDLMQREARFQEELTRTGK